MDSLELRHIINSILEKEDIGLTDLAAKAKMNRSYLSKLINLKTKKQVGLKAKEKMARAFPAYFSENNENNKAGTVGEGGSKGDDKAMIILDRLSQAFIEQAAAFRLQAELMKSIESKMAQQDSQARIESSLSDVRQVVDKLSEGQNKAANRLLKEIQALRQDRTLSKAGGKKKAGNGAAG